jgi:hypothetical protein
MMTNARRRGVGKAGIDRGTENANLRQPSVQSTTLRPDNPELLLGCKTAHVLACRWRPRKHREAADDKLLPAAYK